MKRPADSRVAPLRRLLPLSGILALAACVAAQGTPPSTTLEAVYGVQLTDGTVTFTVRSTGCTRQQHFQIQRDGQRLQLERIQPDRCRKLPSPMEVRFKLPANDGALELANPVLLGAL